MKKLLILLLALPLLFAACKKNDPNSIVGKWEQIDTRVEIDAPDDIIDKLGQMFPVIVTPLVGSEIEFKANKDYGGGGIVAGTYRVKNNILTIDILGDAPMSYQIKTLDETTLVLYVDGTEQWKSVLKLSKDGIDDAIRFYEDNGMTWDEDFQIQIDLFKDFDIDKIKKIESTSTYSRR